MPVAGAPRAGPAQRALLPAFSGIVEGGWREDRTELERALRIGPQLIGINNRDLASFVTDVAVTRTLLPHLTDCTVVSESGLSDPDVVRALQEEGVDAFLVGEALMREPDPEQALRELRGRA